MARTVLSPRPILIRNAKPGLSDRLSSTETERLLRALNARDVAVLAALDNYRYLDQGQIEALFFPSVRTTQRRTRWLTDHGLLDYWLRLRPPGWQRQHSVLLLSRRGARVLAGCRSAEPRPYLDRSRHAGNHHFHLTHDLESNGFFVDLATASRNRSDEGLYHWVGEETCRRTYRQRGGAFSPDGWGRYLTATAEIVLLLEWDRATESPDRLAAKAAGYLRYFTDRAQAELIHVLFVAPTLARELTIQSTFRPLLPAAKRSCCRFWTTNLGRLQEAGPLGAIWHSVGQPDPASTIPDFPGHPRTTRPSEDAIGKPRWWERRPGGGEGA